MKTEELKTIAKTFVAKLIGLAIFSLIVAAVVFSV